VSDYSFRLRVELAPRCALAAPEPRVLLLETRTGQQVFLAGGDDQPISASGRLVLRAAGWPSEEAARTAGDRYASALALACVRSRIGAESWPRRGGGGFFAAGLRMLEHQFGERLLNDTHGLMVFETSPAPRFASMAADAKVATGALSFVARFRHFADTPLELSDAERLAIDLFSASFFEPASDTRLLVLVMAVEALLRPAPRSLAALALVKAWEQVLGESTLPEAERRSLAGQLHRLRTESIGDAGRRLVRERLGEQRYMKMPAPRFFNYCYRLRSRLVHSDKKRPDAADVGVAAGELEIFASDLITVPYGVRAAQEGGEADES
jgi:hypothetical protein